MGGSDADGHRSACLAIRADDVIGSTARKPMECVIADVHPSDSVLGHLSDRRAPDAALILLTVSQLLHILRVQVFEE